MKIKFIFLAVFVLVLFFACDTNDNGDQDIFVPVESITGLPSSDFTNQEITLSGVVNPSTATNQNIAWSITEQGGTGSVLNENILTASNAGTVTVTATILNGLTETSDFVYDFEITFHPFVAPIINSLAFTETPPAESDEAVTISGLNIATTEGSFPIREFEVTVNGNVEVIQNGNEFSLVVSEVGTHDIIISVVAIDIRGNRSEPRELPLNIEVVEPPVLAEIMWGEFMPAGAFYAAGNTDFMNPTNRADALWVSERDPAMIAGLIEGSIFPDFEPVAPDAPHNLLVNGLILSLERIPAVREDRTIVIPQTMMDFFIITPAEWGDITILNISGNPIYPIGDSFFKYEATIKGINYFIYRHRRLAQPGQSTFTIQFN